jgi:hypothetical protein
MEHRLIPVKVLEDSGPSSPPRIRSRCPAPGPPQT